MKNIKAEAVKGVKWTSLASIFRAVIQLIQLLVLARFLSAEDFGLVAIVTVVIGFSQMFSDMGISNAIIQKENITERQLSSLYWLNILIGLIITLLVFMIAPVVAAFYKEDQVEVLVQLLSLSFLINSTGNQYKVLFTRNLNFDLLSKVEITSVLISSVVAIVLAMYGFGAYSLIIGTLVNSVILNLLLIIYGMKKHRPSFVFEYGDIRYFINFGLFQMGQKSIVYFNKQLDVILIGKLLGAEVLGIYSLAKQFLMRPIDIINPIITNVTFPLMSRVQKENTTLRRVYIKLLNIVCTINFPLYLIMALVASDLIPMVFGDKIIISPELFQILCLYCLVRSTTNPSGSLVLAKGRADIGFYWSLGELFFVPMFIFLGSAHGEVGVAFSLLTFQLFSLIPNWYFIVYKMIKLSLLDYFLCQAKPFLAILLGIIFGYALLKFFDMSELLNIAITVPLVILIYVLVSFKVNSYFFSEIINMFRSKVNR